MNFFSLSKYIVSTNLEHLPNKHLFLGLSIALHVFEAQITLLIKNLYEVHLFSDTVKLILTKKCEYFL